MFPSQGYFNSINCPEFVQGKCMRTYCHFYHNDKLYKSKSKYIAKASSSSTTTTTTTTTTATTVVAKTSEENNFNYSYSSISHDQIVHTAATASKKEYHNSGESIDKSITYSTTKELENNVSGNEHDPICKSQQQVLSKSAANEKQEIQLQASKNQKTDYSEKPSSSLVTVNRGLIDDLTANENAPDILKQLISEAVKKVLSENSSLNSTSIDADSILKSLDTVGIVSKAVQEISDNTLTEETVKEKKQPRLYLPPPGTPSYKPTPIKELNNKDSKHKEQSLPIDDEEYTPISFSSISNIEPNDEEITDFSSDEEDNEDKGRSDFDMLEEVLVELSANPSRKKAIQKRKKALGKLASISIPSKDLSIKSSSEAGKNDCLKNSSSTDVDNDSNSNLDTAFHPPSPIFTSSTETATYLPPSQELELNNAMNCSKASQNNSEIDEVKEMSAIENTSEVITTYKPNSVHSTHNLLPQIVELSRPNVKSWSPIAKVDSIMSVEKMLEQLDSIDPEKKSLVLSNKSFKTTNMENDKTVLKFTDSGSNKINVICNKISEPVKVTIDTSNTSEKITPNSKALGEVNSLQGEKNLELCPKSRKRSIDAENSSEKITPNSKSLVEVNSLQGEKNVELCPKSRKRSIDAENSSDNERKRKKMNNAKNHKKHKRKYSSSSDDDDSDSSSTDDDDYYDHHKEKHVKKKSKHKKRKSKRSKDHKKKSKYKRSKKRRRKSSYEKESHSDYSEGNSSTSRSSGNSHKDSSKCNNTSPSRTEIAPLPCHQIKQEKIDIDLSIVKIENISQNVCKNVLSTNLGNDNTTTNKLISSSATISAETTTALDKEMNESSSTKLMEKSFSPAIRLSDKCSSSSSSSSNILIENSVINILDKATVPFKTTNSDSCKKVNCDMQSTTDAIPKALLEKSLYKKNVDSSVEHKGTTANSHKSTDSSQMNNLIDTKSTSSINSKKSPNSSKAKGLKEISIFDDLKNSVNKKRSSRQSSHSLERAHSKKSKEKDKCLSDKSKKSDTILQPVKDFEKDSLKDKISCHEKEKIKLQSSHARQSNHPPHSNKEKHKERSSSKNSSKVESNSKISKRSGSHKEKRSTHESPKSKNSKSKADRSTELEETSHRSRDKVEKTSVHKHKGSKKDATDKNNLTSDISLKDNINEGSDSPIPDLSALDELPKEDWDQLLSTSTIGKETSDSDDGIDFDPGFNDDDDDINDPQVMEECMKAFLEYNPAENPQLAAPKKELQKDQIKNKNDNDDKLYIPTRKVRIAHTGATGNLIPKPKALVRPRTKTPAEIMLERYKKLQEEEAALRIKLEKQRKELEKHGRLPPTVAVSSSSVSSSSDPSPAEPSSTIRSLPSSSNLGGKKRIARAPSNVTALLKSKEQLKSLCSKTKVNSSTTVPPKQTVAMTNVKGTKRIPHSPNLETMKRPIVNTEEGTKVPQNIRQRYLNSFINETLKFCDGESHAYNVALAEENICHKRATTRMVYLNLAVNVIKKLRGFQISEAAQELLKNDPKYESTKEKKVSSSPAVSSSSSPCPSKRKFEHPVNPNHRTVSHFSVMACGGQKGTWSIQKPKKSLPDNIKEYLTGIKFYKCLQKYILNTELLEENGFPRTDPSIKGKAILKKINSRKKISPSEHERYCDRCSILYEVDEWGLPVGTTSCAYHWGRSYKSRGVGGFEARYSCCQGDSQSDGCCLGTTHVSENFSPDSLTGYVRTIPKSPNSDGDYGVFALDCEMCYTTAGCELTRITVIDTNCKTVYEALVKPDNPIIDYNTRFSGITEEDMEGVKVRLRDVQAALLTRFSEKTILMGHSLESDFTALKIIHNTVVDTSVVYPHKLGAPFKRALRNLASEYLTKIIQNDEGGHDSAEDAITCMELMHRKIKEDLKGQY